MTEPADLTPDQLEELFVAAVGAADTQAVEAALRALCVVDPARAVRLYDDLGFALRVVREVIAG